MAQAGGSRASRGTQTGAAAKSITLRLLIWFAVAVSSARAAASAVDERQAAIASYRWASSGDFWHQMERVKRRSASKGKGPPEFAGPISNVSAVLGRDVRLVCEVDNLGQHQVAWLKEETKTILSIATNIIITNYRIFLIPDDLGRKWVLHIKDVEESDRGFYQCQINTNPMRAISGYLDVVVPPSFIESESSQVVEVLEHSNATLHCKASGHPKPSIGWHREDGEPIKLTGGGGGDPPKQDSGPSGQFTGDMSGGPAATWDKSTGLSQTDNQVEQRQLQPLTQLNDVRGDRLQLTKVDRTMAGLYVCTASNGIPRPASRQIPLYVKFAPKVSIPQRTISVNLGDQLDIDCLIEAFPKPTSYWSERRFLRSASPADLVQAKLSSNNAQRDPHRGWLEPLSVGWLGGREFRTTARDVGRSEADRSVLSTRGNTRRHSAGNDWQDGDEVDEMVVGNGVEHKGDDDKEPTRRNSFQPTGTTTSEPVEQRAGNINKNYVTVKQTALNQYTYKLKIIVARVRSSDFGEYMCVSSNPLGTSSARILVKRAELHQELAKTAAGSQALARPSNVSEMSDNQADYQRDSMITNGQVWLSSQMNQPTKLNRPQQADLKASSSFAASRHPKRVYEQQEKKKRDEETKKIEEKISTLQHRAAQGDRKAKVLVKKIEEESKKPKNLNTEPSRDHQSHGHTHKHNHGHNRGPSHGHSRSAPIKKPNSGLTDFDDLMRLAATNTNEVKKKKKPKEITRIKKIAKVVTERVSPPPKPAPPLPRPPIPSAMHKLAPKPTPMARPMSRPMPRPMPSTSRAGRGPPSRYEDEGDYEDEYESDGFVVDDDEEEARAELSKTLRDVFRYDKRRADRLEREVDMHYHAIGRVSTFDDLEREERRATRLAQVEDAIEQRREEERKRKKQRLKSRR